MEHHADKVTSPDLSGPVLIAGGAGKTGRRVAERLRAAGREVRIASRSTAIPLDWNDRATYGPALDGVTTAYIAYYPDLALPGAVAAVAAFAEAARQAGVNRLVLLSGRGEEEAQNAEEVVKASGVDWTIVRASWFAQNFSENFLLDAVRSGTVALPAGPVKEPFVDVEDIADVVAAALTEQRHSRETYELTGPRLLSFAGAVGEIAEAAGRDIRYVEISKDAFETGMRGNGAPDELVDLVLYLFSVVMDGRNQSITDGVDRALGRGPRDFSDYARRTAASQVWEAA